VFIGIIEKKLIETRKT